MLFPPFRRIALMLLAMALAESAAAQKLSPALPLVHTENGPNSAAAQKAHYLVLVSLDGFRWDYAAADDAKHLLALGKRGVWAPEGMLPSYPSLTFPNHFTIVTGLYPEHHGLVANSFYDPDKHARYAIGDAGAVTDGSWYSGTPLWSLAEAQGMRTACLFWPGSEAEIAGHRPTWYARFDSKTEATDAVEQARIDDAVALLKTSAAQRPHFITIYYSEPDHEGHRYGPDAPETKAAVLKMDAILAKLKAALDKTKLPIDLVVVSDHGMVKVDGPWVTLQDFADLSGFETAGSLLYGNTEEDRARVYNQLKKASLEFVVYRRKNVPGGLNYNANPREGDPVVVATGPYAIRAKKPSAGSEAAKPDQPPTVGAHGFDPHIVPEMKASFFAEGPDILPGKTVAPFENVNLYPWMAHMLGLTPPKTDGSLNILAGTLRDNGGEAPEPEPANPK
ncbi:MAG TPA: ectonucleotide pyrophosphatase/phosphodiesterase [Terracidiphilus sp.]|jgi:alkaline phosphatase D|nr:ectonucleotide pyrophosphatase/phosphodiesterase [Terracidiphilus sp.]